MVAEKESRTSAKRRRRREAAARAEETERPVPEDDGQVETRQAEETHASPA